MPLHEKSWCFSPFFMRILLLFALSSLSFANNQYSGVKTISECGKGPKDKDNLTTWKDAYMDENDNINLFF